MYCPSCNHKLSFIHLKKASSSIGGLYKCPSCSSKYRLGIDLKGYGKFAAIYILAVVVLIYFYFGFLMATPLFVGLLFLFSIRYLRADESKV